MALAKICLGPGNKCCLLDSGSVELKSNDRVVLENENGLRLGRVKVVFGDADPQLFPGQIKALVRLATPEDLSQEEQNHALEKRALEFCLRRIQSHRLPIYLVQVECLFDASKIIFYFTADARLRANSSRSVRLGTLGTCAHRQRACPGVAAAQRARRGCGRGLQGVHFENV